MKTMLAGAGLTAVTAAAVLGGAAPAFAKSSETLSGPDVVRAGQSFRLAVWVGDDAGARPAWSRLQVREPRGGYRWLGTWRKMRITGPQPLDNETCSFTVTENHRGMYTFRAMIRGYPAPSPVTVTVR